MSVDEVEPIEEEAADENAVATRGTHLASTQTVTHEYLTQSGKVMRETVTTNQTVTAVMDFVYDESGKPFAMIDQLSAQPKTYYYVLNLQGDVVRLVTDSGAVAASYEYDAWGNILASSGSMAEKNPLRYRGYYYDAETGFYYLQSRYYDPAIRRFINADVYASTDSSDAVSCNMFAYCNNNPTMYVDADGTSGTALIILFVGLLLTLSGCTPVGTPDEDGYVDVGAGAGRTDPNCYGYVFDTDNPINPGDIYNSVIADRIAAGDESARLQLLDTSTYTTDTMAICVLQDAQVRGLKVKQITDPSTYKFGEKDCLVVCKLTESGDDYHFIKRLPSGAWVDKPGMGESRKNAITSYDKDWVIGKNRYTSKPIFFVYTME